MDDKRAAYERRVDHTKIQQFDFDGNLIESITPRMSIDK